MRVAFWSARRRPYDACLGVLRSEVDADLYLLSEVRLPPAGVSGAIVSSVTAHLPERERKLVAWAHHPMQAIVIEERLLVLDLEGLRVAVVLPPYSGYRSKELRKWEAYRNWWSRWPADGFRADLVIGDFNYKITRRPRSAEGRMPHETLGPDFTILTAGSKRIDHAALRSPLTARRPAYLPSPEQYCARDDREILVIDVTLGAEGQAAHLVPGADSPCAEGGTLTTPRDVAQITKCAPFG
jgi:hypothetical protein